MNNAWFLIYMLGLSNKLFFQSETELFLSCHFFPVHKYSFSYFHCFVFPTVLHIWTEAWCNFWQVNLLKWSFPLQPHFWNTAANERGKYLDYLGSTKCLSLRWFMCPHLKGKVFDFSASAIAFLSQSSGAAGFLLWSQEEVPGSSPWERSRGTQVGEPESALEFSVGVFSSWMLWKMHLSWTPDVE